MKCCLDGANLFELYNGLLKARKEQPSLGLDEAVAHLEGRYKTALRQNDLFLQLEASANPHV